MRAQGRKKRTGLAVTALVAPGNMRTPFPWPDEETARFVACGKLELGTPLLVASFADEDGEEGAEGAAGVCLAAASISSMISAAPLVAVPMPDKESMGNVGSDVSSDGKGGGLDWNETPRAEATTLNEDQSAQRRSKIIIEPAQSWRGTDSNTGREN
jgi:hypothetical protein